MTDKPGKWMFGLGILIILTFLFIAGVNAAKSTQITDNNPFSQASEDKAYKPSGTSGTAEEWVETGLLLIVPGTYEEAIDAFDQAIQIDPDYVDAWYQKGKALEGLERYEDAIQAFDQVTRIDPQYADAWNNKGDDWSILGKYQDAINAYDQAIRIDPNYDWPWFNKGDNLFSLGRYQEAIDAYDQAIQIDPENAWPWSGKGDALSKLGRYEDAVKAYNMALKISPDDTDIQKNRDIASGKQGEEGNITGTGSDKQEKNDTDGNTTKVMSVSLPASSEKSPEYQEFSAMQSFIKDTIDSDTVNKTDSGDIRSSLNDYAFYLNANERYDEANSICDQILEKESENWSALSMKGWALLGLNQTPDALTALDKSLDLHPENPLALSNKACALYALGRCPEVIQTLDLADSLDPSNPLNKELRELADLC